MKVVNIKVLYRYCDLKNRLNNNNLSFTYRDRFIQTKVSISMITMHPETTFILVTSTTSLEETTTILVMTDLLTIMASITIDLGVITRIVIDLSIIVTTTKMEAQVLTGL